MATNKPKAGTRRRGAIPCECGGTLRPRLLKSYDFSAYAGMPVTLLDVPGLRCSKCRGETLEGRIIDVSMAIVALEIGKRPERLSAAEAKFLRHLLGITQQELAIRMGIARETVAKWECGDTAISPQHDLILRIFVLVGIGDPGEMQALAKATTALAEGRAVRPEPSVVGLAIASAAADLKSVRSAPPDDNLDPINLKAYQSLVNSWPTRPSSAAGVRS